MKLHHLFLLLLLVNVAVAQDLQTFTVKDYLRHAWTDELVHFEVNLPGEAPSHLTLTDAAGTPVASQFRDLRMVDGRTRGVVWTVISVSPESETVLHLRAGSPPASDLLLVEDEETLVLSNDHLSLKLPWFKKELQGVVALTELPAPVLALKAAEGDTWLGEGTWVDGKADLEVKAASAELAERGTSGLPCATA